MGKLQLFDIILDQDPAVFYPGNLLSGYVVVKLSDDMKMRGIKLLFSGNARVHWSESHRSGSGKSAHTVTRQYSADEPYFNTTVNLLWKEEDQSSFVLPTGEYKYPFQFTLPQNLPSSFEAVTGHVRYFLQSAIDKPWKFNHHCKKAFTVLSILDLNLHPGVQDGQRDQAEKTLCCLCCTSGPITADFWIDRKGYVPGEFVTIFGEVTNHSNKKMNSSSVELRMVTSFHATSKTRHRLHVMSRVVKGEIPVGGSEVWSGEKLHIPPLPSSFLQNCNIINIIYNIVMVVYPSGPSYALNVPLEIVIGTVPVQNVQHVFATGAQEANAAIASAAQDMAPPPSYAECVNGKVNLRDKGDNEYTHGQLEWAPTYPYYIA